MAGGNRYNYLIVFFVALGSFTYGYNSAIIGSVLGLQSFFDYFNIDLTGPNANYGNQITGATNGLFSGGGMIGCMIVAWLADKVGRRKGVQIICVICIISAIIQGASVHIAMFLVGRFLNGVGVGMMAPIVPTYLSEVSPAGTRGRMVASHGILAISGYSLASWTGFGCYFENNPAIQWRLCLTLQVVAPLLLICGSPWMPESPRWLIFKDRHEEGLAVLRKLHRRPEDPDEIFAREEHLQIRQQVALDATLKLSFIGLWKRKSTRRRLLTGLFVQMVCQSTGVLVINNYQVILYNGLGLNGSTPLLLYAVYNTVAASMNWVNSMIIDRVGRVRLLTIGLTGCLIALALETAMVAKYGGTTNRVGDGFGVFFLFLYVLFYAGCLDACSYVYCSEIFPTWMRAQGVGFSLLGLFGGTLIYTQAATTAFASIGWKYYLVFLGLTFCGIWVVVFWLPETKNLALEEIGALFGDEVALDLTHLTTEQRAALDAKLFDIDVYNKAQGERQAEVIKEGQVQQELA